MMGVMAAPQTEARLLVVEDDANILELLSASLRFAGFDVSTATSGSAAVSAAKNASPDLVVLDVMLPDLDGFEVIRLMREGGQRTPVVFLTARDGTDDKIRGLTLGGDDYVTKPFSLEELTARIRAVLRRTTQGDEEPSRLVFAALVRRHDAAGKRSGEEAAGVPGVDVAHPLRVGRDVRGQGRADLAHEGQGRFRRCPDPQHQGTLGGRVAEAVPLPARSHEQRPGHRFGRLVVAVYEQPAAEHVDRLVELVVRVRDGSGEMRRDGELHGGEAGRQAVLAREDVRRLASVGERGPVAAVGKQD